MMSLRKPLVTLALASSALGLSLGASLNPADAATQGGTTTTAVSSSTAPTSAANSGLAVVLLSHNTPDVEDDWTVEWQIMNTSASPLAQARPAVPSRTGSMGPPPPA
jgi:hypothetical protein